MTRKEITDRLEELCKLDYTISIKSHIDEIEQLRNSILWNDSEVVYITNLLKNRIQKEAGFSLELCNYWGAWLMATGIGKTKAALDTIQYKTDNSNCYIVVPTEKLRDIGWPSEIKKWGLQHYIPNIKIICYASLRNVKNEVISYIIFDEGHHLSINDSDFFLSNKIHGCLYMTATRPTNEDKIAILTKLKIFPRYTITFDQAVRLGIVAPYEISIINMELDSTTKNVKAGTKAKPFYQTEKQAYDYYSKLFSCRSSTTVAKMRRLFMYNLQSKIEVAKLILKHVIPQDKRTLIFCSNKNQAIEVCEYRYYSKPVLTKKDRDNPEKIIKHKKHLENYQSDLSYYKFHNLEINRISSVDALNEGENFNDLDIIFIIQVKKELNIVQQLGRACRFRPDHKAKVIILCIGNTIDEQWTKDALKNMDANNITGYELSKLRTGLEKINF